MITKQVEPAGRRLTPVTRAHTERRGAQAENDSARNVITLRFLSPAAERSDSLGGAA